MARNWSIVGIAGNVTRPSRTRVLVEAVLAALGTRLQASPELIDLADTGSEILRALRPDQLSEPGRALIKTIEDADILVVGTPVYRGSYTGVIKHVFDLVRQDAFSGKPVILTATGGSALHALVTEHQLRPLLSFFGAHTVPTAIYAVEGDFKDYRIVNPALADRVARAAGEAARLARSTTPAVSDDDALYRQIAAG